MLYGPHHSDVQMFISSLPYLTYADWYAAKMHAVRHLPNFDELLDAASLEVVGALFDPALDRALTAAKAATIAAIETLPWFGEHPDVKSDAFYALGALVVLDEVPFEKVWIRFMPFRHTRVVLPVDWES